MSARSLTGTLRRDDFGGAVYVLDADDGAQWQLRGNGLDAAVGQRVRVTGAEAAAQFGFAMVGPVFEVKALEVLGG